MIVFLTGPTGSGKTDTSWALVAASDTLVFLDCDWFAARAGFDWADPGDVDSVFRAIRSQMDFHIADGRNNFVVTLTLEMARTFGLAEFAKLAPPVFSFRLFAAPDVIARRIAGRGRPQSAQEQANAISQQAAFDRLFPDDALFMRLDTSALDSDDIAKLIARKIRE
ncbi:MAG TPA: hypothetical protein VG867_06635 [Rhizomicrobium sp.]|nr:hypothetical protein [Rhizomicrobium sp.]